jgi:hypothetical protein
MLQTDAKLKRSKTLFHVQEQRLWILWDTDFSKEICRRWFLLQIFQLLSVALRNPVPVTKKWGRPTCACQEQVNQTGHELFRACGRGKML